MRGRMASFFVKYGLVSATRQAAGAGSVVNLFSITLRFLSY